MPDDIARDRGATGRRPATPASPRPRDPELGRLDAALAGDVDELLSGSVEDVSRVLDTLFEESSVEPMDTSERSLTATEPPHREPDAVDQGPTSAPVSAPPVTTWHAPADPEHPDPCDHGSEHDAWDDQAAGAEPAWDSLGPARPHPLAVVLGIANAPYGMLPAAGRRIVDLLAITLLIWVPIVWIAVLVLRR